MPDIGRWRATWRGLGAEADASLFGELSARYLEPHRAYHTIQHLDECFARLDEAGNPASHPYEVELAIWFHDAIYDVRATDNEERSAAWAHGVALASGLSGGLAERIRHLILATRHNAAPASPDAALVVDVDLAILGAPPDRFDEYEQQVRQEYAWVPGFLFRRKRREILEAFLARPHLFHTTHFRTTYEDRARANLEHSIERLGG